MGNSKDGNLDGFSAQAKALFSRADKFHSTTVQANAARWELNDRASNQGAMREAAKLGFTGMEVERERGGLGLGVREKLRVAEILGRSSLSFALGLLASQNVAVRLSKLGSARHRADLLPGLLAGTRFGAVASPSRASKGRQSESSALRATKNPSGWQLTGQSNWLVNAAVSDVFICYADTGTQGAPKDLACFVVRSGQVGFKQASPYRLVAGSPMGVGGFELENFQCLDSDMLVGPGDAMAAAVEDSNCERLEISVLVCTAMRSSLAAAVDSIKKSQAHVDGDLADAVTKLEAAEALTASALDHFCQDPYSSRTSAIVAEAKKFVCDVAESSLSSSMRQLGRDGLREADPVGRLIAECRVLNELSGSGSDLRAETLDRLTEHYTSSDLAESTVTGPALVSNPGPASDSDVVDLRETTTPSPVGSRAASETTTIPSPIPPMPPSDRRLASVPAAAEGDDHSDPNDDSASVALGDERNTPPMPPPAMKRAGS